MIKPQILRGHITLRYYGYDNAACAMKIDFKKETVCFYFVNILFPVAVANRVFRCSETMDRWAARKRLDSDTDTDRDRDRDREAKSTLGSG